MVMERGREIELLLVRIVGARRAPISEETRRAVIAECAAEVARLAAELGVVEDETRELLAAYPPEAWPPLRALR